MAVVVDTIHGRLEGLQEEGLQSFRGIPFAKPPLGPLPPELFFAIETDRVFRIPAVRLAEAQSAHQAQRPRTWAYLVCWGSPLMGGSLGACHGIDIPFVFGSVGRRGMQRFSGSGPDAERLSARMMDAWLAFARGGDPNHADLPDWAPYDAERRATLIFDREPGVSLAPFDAERSAWDGLF